MAIAAVISDGLGLGHERAVCRPLIPGAWPEPHAARRFALGGRPEHSWVSRVRGTSIPDLHRKSFRSTATSGLHLSRCARVLENDSDSTLCPPSPPRGCTGRSRSNLSIVREKNWDIPITPCRLGVIVSAGWPRLRDALKQLLARVLKEESLGSRGTFEPSTQVFSTLSASAALENPLRAPFRVRAGRHDVSTTATSFPCKDRGPQAKAPRTFSRAVR